MKRRTFLRNAALASTLLWTTSRVGCSPFSRNTPWKTFFRTEGRHIVAERTGERVVFRGLNVNGLEYGNFPPSPYTGPFGQYYIQIRPQDVDLIASLGGNVMRLPIAWARLFPGWRPWHKLPNKLFLFYLQRIDDAIKIAERQGIYVILTMFDYLKYWASPEQLVCVESSPAHQKFLAHTWKLLAERYRDNTTVLGYDIMNEPVRREEPKEPCSYCDWPAIAQQVINAIRQVDPHHLIFVEGGNYSAASDWILLHGTQPFVQDSIRPSRIVYSPHGYLDFDKDSRYTTPGEEDGPIGQWKYAFRDRCLPAIEWSIANEVPLFWGEINVPCHPKWAEAFRFAFQEWFAPAQISLALWHAVRPDYCPPKDCPINVYNCKGNYQIDVIRDFPGGVYAQTTPPNIMPATSLLYDQERINPWHFGTGFFEDTNHPGISVQFDALSPDGSARKTCRLELPSQSKAGLKFLHFGLTTQRYGTLRLRLWKENETPLALRLFTTIPGVPCRNEPHGTPYPKENDKRPMLQSYTKKLTPRTWHNVEIPLQDLIAPDATLINGLAFQGEGTKKPIGPIYFARIELLPASKNPME